jgi:preprotein translocase subunit SecG
VILTKMTAFASQITLVIAITLGYWHRTEDEIMMFNLHPTTGMYVNLDRQPVEGIGARVEGT